MSKFKVILKLRSYDKKGRFFGEASIYGNSYDEVFAQYMDYVKLVIKGEFTNIRRLDLVSGNRVLFSFCSVRHLLESDQRNYLININPF